MDKIKLPKEVVDYFKINASLINDGESNWMYYPFWLKDNNDGTFVIVSFEHLPQSVKDRLESKRI